ncbi:DUF1684 domain-containing protein [Arcicella sp. LKC2W]|uniref:DUF1684 domain-containing protein n=1 Tax=Arcicella sp. LKC2W TaxID=2984198 RepID=UPI002B214738|nr:DUF1684 domain-containing protein [Arcicella sp. LKC2W]MEA5461813.1 DUF1684 domain-containing protein [Arcicella sp. LKC2W]
MFKNKFFLLSVTVVLIAIILYSLTGNETPQSSTTGNDDQYLTPIQDLRKQKDDFLKTDKESPIKEKATFKGLKYFEINPNFKVVGKLDKFASDQTINISMTDGSVEEYEAYGNVSFEIEGKKYALKIFKTPEGNLFLPFKDLTSNKETYGAGRYLDFGVNDVKNNQIEIDFNKAYQPYCAYNETFTCPITPAENFLNLALKVGERQ